MTFEPGETTKNVTIAETQQPGYTLTQSDGKNAVCTAGNTTLEVTNDSDVGFTVAASPTQTVTCIVLNQAPNPSAQVRVVKSWTIDGVDYSNANRPNGFGAALQLTGQAAPQFNTTYSGYSQGETITIGESVTIPPGCANVASGDLGEQTLPGGSSVFSLKNTVTCETKLTLVKRAQNPYGNAAPAQSWTLNATKNGDASPTLSGSTGTPEVSSVNVIPGEVYVLTESGGPSGYLQEKVPSYSPDPTLVPQPTGSWHCRIDGASADYDGLNGGVTVQLGQSVTCTAINQAVSPKLTLVKTVAGVNPEPATNWTLQAQSSTQIIGGATGSAAVTQVPVAPGNYILSETGPTQGYVASDWLCLAGTTPVPVVDGSIAVGLGADITCTITNTAQPTFLRILKTVENSHGGTADADDWALAAAGPTPLSGTRDVSGAVLPGTYTFTETGGPAGYRQTGFSCWVNGSEPRQPVPTTNGMLDLARGQGVSCEFINSDEVATLTLVKIVAPGEAGGPLDPASAWMLTANGPTPITGPSGSPFVTSVEVSAGAYDLSEEGPSGYLPGSWQCEGGVVNESQVTVGNGANVVCQITNTADSPRLTLVKTVENSNGGTSGPQDWELSAVGPTPIAGASGAGDVTSRAIEPGYYSLDESGPSGYELESLTCVTAAGDPFRLVDNGIDVGLGDNVICTFVNQDQASQLKLIKRVAGNDETGGQAIPSNWTLSATTVGGIVIVADGESEFTEAKAGGYTLVESSNDDVKTSGYTNGTWSCLTDDQVELPTIGIGDPASGHASLDLPLGAKVTCTITNTATPSLWKIVKTSDPATGATVQPGSQIDYTLTLTKLSGVAGSNIVITDDLSDVLDDATLVGDPAFTASAGTATQSGTTATWTVPTLQDVATLNYTVKINDNVTGATLRNVVTRGVEPCRPELGDSCITEHFTPQWTVAKTSNPATGTEVLPGSTIEYTIAVTNTGAVPVTGLLVTDDLSGLTEHATLATDSVVAGLGTWTTTAAKLQWSIASLPVGSDPVTLRYTVTVNADAWDTNIKNVITGRGVVPPADCAAEAGTDPGSKALSPSCSTDHPTPKQPKLELIKVVDNGARTVPASPPDWTLSATPIVLDSQPVRSGPGGFASVAVLPGEFALSEQASNPAVASGFAADPWKCLNRVTDAAVSVSNTGTIPVAAGTDVVCTITNRAVPVDLGIIKTHTAIDGSAEVIADPGKGQQFRYHLAITNGNTDATGVTVTDAIPDSLTVDAASIVAPAGWTATIADQNADSSGGKLTASFAGTFAAGTNAEITFIVTIGDIAQPDTSVAIANIKNTACVTGTEEDSNPDNNCSIDEVPVKSIVLTAQAVCRADTPWLDYSISAVNYVAADFTVMWWNTKVWNEGAPTGPASAQTPIPLDKLSGSILWPGAVLDGNGKIIEWPGWREGGTVEDPSAPGGDLRPSAVVQIVSNPSVESATVYPPPTPNCNPNPPTVKPPKVKTVNNSVPVVGAPVTERLAQTGIEVAGWLAAAGAVIAGGMLMLRRRRTPSSLVGDNAAQHSAAGHSTTEHRTTGSGD